MRNILETAAIFGIQSMLWALIPWDYEPSKLNITLCYLSLFAVAFAIVAIAEMAYESFTGKEIPG